MINTVFASSREHDEDQAFDPAHAEIFSALGQPESQPAAPTAPHRRTRGHQRRPGPDTALGLAHYFNDHCPAPSWTHGMQTNSLKGLAAAFREMREHGLDAEQIRALIDLYFTSLGPRVPRSAYWLDFKGSRWRLLKALETSREATAEEYDAWTAPAPDNAPQDPAEWSW